MRDVLVLVGYALAFTGGTALIGCGFLYGWYWVKGRKF